MKGTTGWVLIALLGLVLAAGVGVAAALGVALGSAVPGAAPVPPAVGVTVAPAGEVGRLRSACPVGGVMGWPG